MTPSTVGSVLHAFFEDYLKCQKGLSTASIRSYRDGIRLFLQFISRDTKRAISRLALAAAIPAEPASPVFTGSAALAFRKP